MMGARHGPPVGKRPVGLWLTADDRAGKRRPYSIHLCLHKMQLPDIIK